MILTIHTNYLPFSRQVGEGSRLSTACLYNLRSTQTQRSEVDGQYTVSPVSTMAPMVTPVATPVNDEKHAVFSPVEKAAYFPDDKICLSVSEGIEIQQATTDIAPQVALPPPKSAEADSQKRQQQIPFWRRHIWWITGSIVLLLILISILLSLAFKSSGGNENTTKKAIVTNSTANSVASSGLFLRDGETWNMHLFAQNKTGSINLQISLDGSKFAAFQPVSLTIPPRIPTPMTATAEQDAQTGVVMVNIFRIEKIEDAH